MCPTLASPNSNNSIIRKRLRSLKALNISVTLLKSIYIGMFILINVIHLEAPLYMNICSYINIIYCGSDVNRILLGLLFENEW